jgi:hypothetical protein
MEAILVATISIDVPVATVVGSAVCCRSPKGSGVRFYKDNSAIICVTFQRKFSFPSDLTVHELC